VREVKKTSAPVLLHILLNTGCLGKHCHSSTFEAMTRNNRKKKGDLIQVDALAGRVETHMSLMSAGGSFEILEKATLF
jgi:hypothetical protein